MSVVKSQYPHLDSNPRPPTILHEDKAVTADETGTNHLEQSQQGGLSATAPDAFCAAMDRARGVTEVARNHLSSLVRFLAARTGSTEDAKEILQEAYVKMLMLDRSVTIGRLEAYFWRVAVNLAVDRGRRQALDQRFRGALPIDERQEFSTDAIVEARERLTIVERAISELPARCLEAFVLHIQNGMTFAEVGREMGISERMAKKHLARALEYLQSCLAAAEETNDTLRAYRKK